jgi:hypothetical protein
VGVRWTRRATGLRVLVDALDVGEPVEYLEASNGAIAVAAAAVVAWMCDAASMRESPYGEAAATWVRRTVSQEIRLHIVLVAEFVAVSGHGLSSGCSTPQLLLKSQIGDNIRS